jgi:hypothetical protein
MKSNWARLIQDVERHHATNDALRLLQLRERAKIALITVPPMIIGCYDLSNGVTAMMLGMSLSVMTFPSVDACIPEDVKRWRARHGLRHGQYVCPVPAAWMPNEYEPFADDYDALVKAVLKDCRHED